MVNITGIIYTLLGADSAVVAIVNDRVFPLLMPQKTVLPAVVVTVFSNSPLSTKDGKAETDFSRVQISSYAGTYKQAFQLDRAIRVAIDSFDGAVNDGVESWNVKNIRYENTNDVFETEKEIFHRASDYEIMVGTNLVEVDAPGDVDGVWELENGAGYLELESNTDYWLLEAA